MFKSPRSLFSDPELAPEAAGQRWGRAAWVVLGRHLCVHFVLDARGVPGRQTGAFVSLLAPRQTPFADAASVFLRQADRVHVWAWPQSLQEAALKSAGAPGRRVVVVPESLFGLGIADGAVFRDSAQGVEGLRFEGSNLVDTTWWPTAPDATARARWAQGAVQRDEPGSALQRAKAGRTWSTAWRPLVGARSASVPGAAVLRQQALPLAAWCLLAVAAALATSAWREQRLLQAALQQTQARLDRGLADVRANQRMKGPQQRAPVSVDAQWQDQARSATRSLQFGQVWEGLAAALNEGGFLVREFVFERGEVKLTLVSGFGVELDLASAIVALESSGLWSKVEILDLANPAAVRFGAKPRESLFEPAPR